MIERLSKNRQNFIIIPALNPDERLIPYVSTLLDEGFSHIIVVDDGSDSVKQTIFNELEHMGCILIHHESNKGKGRALKSAFRKCCDINLQNRTNWGCITVDSDGQHTLEDVIAISDGMSEKADALYLGVRCFQYDHVPLKSRLGNEITKVIMKLLVGGNISDTQTGLRGIPAKFYEELMNLPGERFEYETEMLSWAIHQMIEIREIPIQTVYENNNSGTHFRAVRDSVLIYSVLFKTFFKYSASAVLSFLLDYGLFCCIIHFLVALESTKRIWIATVLARVCSSLFNYFFNAKVVFEGNTGKKSLIEYYLLVLIQMCVSAFTVNIFSNGMNSNIRIVKVIIEFCLFLVNYVVQKNIIFKKNSVR